GHEGGHWRTSPRGCASTRPGITGEGGCGYGCSTRSASMDGEAHTMTRTKEEQVRSYRHMNRLDALERRRVGRMGHEIVGVTWTDVERECRVELFYAFWAWVLVDLERFQQLLAQGYF